MAANKKVARLWARYLASLPHLKGIEDMFTDWYPQSILPVYAGWYQIVFGRMDDPQYRWFDSKKKVWRFSPNGKVSCFGDVGDYPSAGWRGRRAK